MSLRRSELHTHIEDGGIYRLIETAALMKHPDTGEWLSAIIYADSDPWSPRRFQVYTTTEARWREKFRVYEPAITRSPPTTPRVDEL